MLHIERRHLPEFSAIAYHFVDLGQELAPIEQETFDACSCGPNSPEEVTNLHDGSSGAVSSEAVSSEAVSSQFHSRQHIAAQSERKVADEGHAAPARAKISTNSSPSCLFAGHAESGAALVRLLRSQLSSALSFIAEAEAAGGDVLLHAGQGPVGLSFNAVVYVALASFIHKHGDSLQAAMRRLSSSLFNMPTLPLFLERDLELFASECLKRRIAGEAASPQSSNTSVPAEGMVRKVAKDCRLEAVFETTLETLTETAAADGNTERISAEETADEVRQKLAQGWTSGRIGKYEVLFAQGAADSAQDADESSLQRTFIG